MPIFNLSSGGREIVGLIKGVFDVPGIMADALLESYVVVQAI